MKKILMLAALISMAVIVTCYTNPETGRKGLMLLNASQEAELGLTEFNEIKASTPRT